MNPNPTMTGQPLRLIERPRRLRSSAHLRRLVRETRLTADHLVQPLFVKDGLGAPAEIASLPGQCRLSLDSLLQEAENCLRLGLPAVALFPVIESTLKDPQGREALNDQTLVLRAARALKQRLPELLIITDIALDPYTTHGHDGLLTPDGSGVDNDRTVEVLAQMAVLHAAAGVDLVAPSDMMDGRVGAIRASLDGAGYSQTAILAYTAKYASAYYGPFREAVGSAQAAGTRALDKRTYQLDPANRREAQREARLDAAEGADILMVKPAGPYLDIIRDLRETTELPLAAYQVSGEYAQLHAAARLGWLDLTSTRDEALLAIHRAGADLILTYFARSAAHDWQNQPPS